MIWCSVALRLCRRGDGGGVHLELLIPAIEQSEDMGKLSFLPAFIGFWIGVLFLLLLDRLIPHLHVGSEQAEGPKSKLGRTTMMSAGCYLITADLGGGMVSAAVH